MRDTNTISSLLCNLLLCVLTVTFGSACSLSPNIKGEIDHPISLHISHLGIDKSYQPPLRIIQAQDKIIYSYSGMRSPSYFSMFLLEHTIIHPGESVLDLGTGSGIQSIFAADKASKILSTDINEKALEITRLNAHRNNVAEKVTTRISDIFNNIKPAEKFDVILSSLPYPYRNKYGNSWKLHERFFANVQKHLKPGGRIYFLTGNLNNFVRTREMIEKNNLKIMRLDMASYIKYNIEMMVYTIQRNEDALKQKADYTLPKLDN